MRGPNTNANVCSQNFSTVLVHGTSNIPWIIQELRYAMPSNGEFQGQYKTLNSMNFPETHVFNYFKIYTWFSTHLLVCPKIVRISERCLVCRKWWCSRLRCQPGNKKNKSEYVNLRRVLVISEILKKNPEQPYCSTAVFNWFSFASRIECPIHSPCPLV